MRAKSPLIATLSQTLLLGSMLALLPTAWFIATITHLVTTYRDTKERKMMHLLFLSSFSALMMLLLGLSPLVIITALGSHLIVSLGLMLPTKRKLNTTIILGLFLGVGLYFFIYQLLFSPAYQAIWLRMNQIMPIIEGDDIDLFRMEMLTFIQFGVIAWSIEFIGFIWFSSRYFIHKEIPLAIVREFSLGRFLTLSLATIGIAYIVLKSLELLLGFTLVNDLFFLWSNSALLALYLFWIKGLAHIFQFLEQRQYDHLLQQRIGKIVLISLFLPGLGLLFRGSIALLGLAFNPRDTAE